MVVCPPSVGKDGVYRWLNKLEIAEAPAAWVEALSSERREREPLQLTAKSQFTAKSQNR